jgi:hypothetical protein
MGENTRFKPGLTHLASRILVLAIVPLILAGCALPPTDHVLTRETTAECTAAQVADWNEAWQNSLRVAASDLAGHRIDNWVALGPWWRGRNWYPNDIYKQTLCGVVDAFFVEPAATFDTSDENDWNYRILPDPFYADLLISTVDDFEQDEVKDCAGGTENCLYADRGLATMDISEEMVRNVFSNAGDVDNGRQHTLVYEGNPLLRVREQGYPDGNVQVWFDEVCRLPDDRLLGYVMLTSQVGWDYSGGEGFHLLRVDQTGQPGADGVSVGRGPLVPIEPPVVTVCGSLIGDSLRRVTTGGTAQLLGDVRLQIEGSPGATRADLEVSEITLVAANERRQLEIQPSAEGEVVVRSVPILQGVQFQVVMKSGIAVRLDSEGYALAPQITQKPAAVSHAGDAAWPVMVSSDGSDPGGPSPEGLLFLQEWHVEATPFYAAIVRGGEVALEEGSRVARQLNEIVHTDGGGRIEEIFGRRQPFSVRWSFQVTNLTTGASVPVVEGEEGDPRQIVVAYVPSEVPNARVKIVFPQGSEDDVYEVLARATMLDTFGLAGVAERTLWSHAVAADSGSEAVEAMLSVVAQLADVDTGCLLTASLFDDGLAGGHGFSSRERLQARRVRLSVMRAAEDELITVGELTGLIARARLFDPSSCRNE